MKTLSLNGIWSLTYGTFSEQAPCTPQQLKAAVWPSIAATVPGNVELDLMQAGLLPDIQTGDRIYDVQLCEGHQWWYHRTFGAPDRPADHLTESSPSAMWIIEWTTENGKSGRNHYLAGTPPFDLEQYRAWLMRAGLLPL